MKLTKPVLRVLEKCFQAEVRGSLPAQVGRGQHYRINGIPVSAAVMRADADGLIEQVDERRTFNDGLPPLTIRGFMLTHRGRYAYCQWASKNCDDSGE